MAAVPSGWRIPCASYALYSQRREGSRGHSHVDHHSSYGCGAAGWDLRGEARSGCWGGLVSGGDGTERPGQRDTPAAAAALRFRAGQGLAIAGTAERSGWPSSSPAASPGGRC